MRLLGDKALADEVAVSVFLSAWKNISLIRVDMSFGSWLCSIAVYSSLEKVRQNSGNIGVDVERKFKGIKISSFEAVVLSLPVKERLVFVLRDLEKYTEEETAELLMISKSEAQNFLINAHNNLRISNSAISQVTPLNESISSLPEQIMPGNDVWKIIYSEIHNINEKNSNKVEELGSDRQTVEIEKKKEEKEKKFNFFGWKKK